MGSVDVVHADFTHLFVVFYAQMLIKSQLESSFKTYFNVLETRQLFHLVHLLGRGSRDAIFSPIP